MYRLCQEAEGDHQHKDNQNNQCKGDELAIAATKLRGIGSILYGYNLVQVFEIMKQLWHLCIAFLWIAPDHAHDNGCQRRREVWIDRENGRRIICHLRIHVGKFAFTLKRDLPTEQFVENNTHGIDIAAWRAMLAPEEFRCHIVW